MAWTSDQIAALAPDASTEKRGRSLASANHWITMGWDGRALWGECKGSGLHPYRTQIDLQAPAFSCSCPVPKPPCKHALGLFFLHAQQPALFASSPMPEWVAEWIGKRDARQAQSEARATAPVDPEAAEKSQKDKEKRWEKRLDRMADGIQELHQWLQDLVRQGFLNVAITESDFWNAIALRMVDAQLPRLSGYLKETCQLIQARSDWAVVALGRIGELFLLVRAFAQRDRLAPAQLDELMNAVGVTIQKSELLETQAPCRDAWFVLGQLEDLDIERRPFRRVWLQGLESGQYALLLDFSFGNQGFDQHYLTSSQLDGELYFYPAHHPQRAIIPQYTTQPNPDLGRLRPYPDFERFLQAYAAGLAANPWLLQFPGLLADVLPYAPNLEQPEAELLDSSLRRLPLVFQRPQDWHKLLAISGGHPISLFGEWDGYAFRPLAVWANGRYTGI